jgi:CheY-like chemotaxis protein
MSLQLLNVVLVDDDADDRTLFKEAMDEIRVRTKLSLFSNGQELMDFLLLPNILLPQVIFLDLNMPIKNGLQTLKEIRSHRKLDALSIAIYSTSSSERDIEETFINGANIYINKPNNFLMLKEAIEKVLQINWQYHTSNLDKSNFLLRI